MKRLALLMTVGMLCLVGSAVAADQEQKEQQGAPQAIQSSAAAKAAEGPNEQTAAARSDCKGKASKRSKRHRDQSGSAVESQVPQYQVEYGGGG